MKYIVMWFLLWSVAVVAVPHGDRTCILKVEPSHAHVVCSAGGQS